MEPLVHLDLSDLPADPLEQLAHLLDLEVEIEALLESAYARAYFEARVAGQLDIAFRLGRHSRTSILKMTRAENLRRGGILRWGDGMPDR